MIGGLCDSHRVVPGTRAAATLSGASGVPIEQWAPRRGPETAARVVELDVLTTVPMMAVNEPDPDDAGIFELTLDGSPAGVRKAPVGNVIELDAGVPGGGAAPEPRPGIG